MSEFFKPEPTKAEGFSKLTYAYRDGRDGNVRDGWKTYTLGETVFETQEEAIKVAKALRAKRILSLKNQIKTLESFD